MEFLKSMKLFKIDPHLLFLPMAAIVANNFYVWANFIKEK